MARLKTIWDPETMTDTQADNPAPDVWRFNPRAFLARGAFLAREWPYLLVLILRAIRRCIHELRQNHHDDLLDRSGALHRSHLRAHVLRETNREQRSRLIWTQRCIGVRCSWQCI